MALGRLESLEDRAHQAIKRAKSLLYDRFRPDPETTNDETGGWNQFLNEADKPPSVTGSSHGILALIACGEPVGSEVITRAVSFIDDNQCNDGGWSKPRLVDECSLTRITALATRTLLNVHVNRYEACTRHSIEWLIAAQNEDGGWGNTAKDGKSDTTSTGFALQALERTTGSAKGRSESISNGVAWLIQARNPEYSWGHSCDEQGTVAHTSEAIDGIKNYDSNIGHSAAWIKEHIGERSSFNERYTIEGGSCDGQTLRWTQMSIERGLIAILKSGASPADKEVIDSVDAILNKQCQPGYWSTRSFPNSEPVWATKEALIGLRLFLDCLEKKRSSVVLSEEINVLKDRLDRQSIQINALSSELEQRKLMSRVNKLLAFAFQPSILFVAALLILACSYLLLNHFFDLPEYANTLASIMGIIGGAIACYQTYKKAKE